MKIVTTLLIIVFTSLLAADVTMAQSLPRATPKEVGLSLERLNRITQVLRDDVSKRVIPGAVLLVARHGKVAYFEAIGSLNPATEARMTQDAIFRIYSMSKPITSVAAMILVEEGKISLDEPIAKYLPQFAEMKVAMPRADAANGRPAFELVPAKRPITIQDLMRHTSGITYGFFGDTIVKKAYVEAGVTRGDFTNAEFADRIAKLPLSYQPGTTWDYSHSTDILGRLIEVVSGVSLYEFEKQRLFDPLRMMDTSFYATDSTRQLRIAEPFQNDRTIGVDAEFNDPRLATKFESGGAGLISTAADYARFLQMLLNGGTLDGKRYLSPRTVTYMTSDHLGGVAVPEPLLFVGDGYGFGLGFAVRRSAGVSAVPGSLGDYTWAGIGGTYFWVDPKEDLFVVFMMQSVKQRLHYHSLLRDMIYAAVFE